MIENKEPPFFLRRRCYERAVEKMKIHELKIEWKYYREIKSLRKKFEVRKNDRDFREGDFLIFNSISNIDGSLKREREIYRIGYILDNFEGLAQGYVAFSIKPTGLFND